MKIERIRPTNWPLRLLEVAITYIFVILAHGYIYGHRDMIEITPYVKYLLNPELFPNDFFIQNLVERFPNERYAFVHFLKIFGAPNPWIYWGLHLSFSFLMISGFLNMAELFIKEKKLVYFAAFLAFIVLYPYNLGGNNLYNNMLTPGFVASSIGIWSLYYLVRAYDHRSILLLIPATFIHPLVGLQLFIIYTGVFAVRLITKQFFRKSKSLILSMLAYILTAGVWMYWLFQTFSKGQIADETFFEIIQFRLAHHFIPSAFGGGNYALLIPMFLIGWHLNLKRNARLFWVFNIVLLGLIVYSIAVEGFHASFFISTQWFKTTMWLKILASIAIVFVGNQAVMLWASKWKSKLVTLGMVLLGVAGIFLGLKFNQRHADTRDFPWTGIYTDAQKIAIKAKESTPADALFLTPPNFTYLKHYGERSTYVDYKAIVHHKTAMQEWYRRVKQVFQFDGSAKNSLERLNIASLPTDLAAIQKYQSLGITHLITEQSIDSGKLLDQAGKYYLYEIKE